MSQGSPSAGSPQERLRRLVRDLTGLDLSGRRGHPFAVALARAARTAGDPDDASHARALLEGRRPLRSLVEELTVGETWFFRDAAQWAFIDGTVLPEARARRRDRPGHRLRAWSAGCATGEEAYSLAIAAADAGLGRDVHLLGTDLNETALERARAAEFSVWSLRGEAAGRARRHLREAHGKLALDPSLARTVRFFPLNLAGAEYPSPQLGLADLDLVLCRNVLVYLEASVLPEVARRLHGCLAPGGWLLTGAADPILQRHAPFEVSAGAHGLAYRRPERSGPKVPVAAARRGLPAALRPAPRAAELRRPRPRPAPAAPPALDARALLDAARPADALALIDAALARRPLDAAAHFERAVALTELGRPEDAEEACRRALYLARGEPFVQFFSGMLRLRRGDRAGARRAFRAAAALLAGRAPDEDVPMSHGLTARALSEAVRAQLSAAGGDPGAPPTLG